MSESTHVMVSTTLVFCTEMTLNLTPTNAINLDLHRSIHTTYVTPIYVE